MNIGKKGTGRWEAGLKGIIAEHKFGRNFRSLKTIDVHLCQVHV